MLKDLQFFLTLLVGLFLITGCNEDDDYIEVTPLVINLDGINTEYDDFNSAGPTSFNYSGQFVYSTNVGSAGKEFDIWRAELSLSTSGNEMPTSEYDYSIDSKKIAPFYHSECNSEYNEFGPYLWMNDYTSYDQILNGDFLKYGLYFFASDRPSDSTENKLNLYYYDNTTSKAKLLPNINSKSNDAYACFTNQRKNLIFCSDRDGQFDIYQSDIANPLNNSSQINSSTFTNVKKNETLSSTYDDKCPYFLDNILLFVSNRYGDHSNFDIYFSRLVNNNWTTPTRCPEVMEDEDVEIVSNITDNRLLNSTSNEYRPILVKGWSINADEPYIIIFSSDRPGGKGGYDLHLAILPDNIFNWFKKTIKQKGYSDYQNTPFLYNIRNTNAS